MGRVGKELGVLGLVPVVAVTTGLALFPDATSPDEPGQWRIEARSARIIGGYGDNFAYDGTNVRPVEGTASVTLDTSAGTGRVEINLRTTPESGPIRFSEDQSWEGEIRIVQRLDASETDLARIQEEVWLHGDTGNEAPVMPKLFNYFATWGPSAIWVNGRELVPMIGSHTMFSEQARDDEGRIVNTRGQVYSPMAEDKTGFTSPSETEFHYVAHTSQPDPNNFPPHRAWIHLHFANVDVQAKPDEVEIPYAGGR